MPFDRHAENCIAALRGLPPDKRRSILRPACSMDSLIEAVLEKHHIGKPKPEDSIMSHWRAIVGENNAHRCSPVRLTRQGALLIAAANPVLRRELLFQKNRILQTVRSLPGCENISSVRFQPG